jgi:nucleotide-binding universal stress UspA family protein
VVPLDGSPYAEHALPWAIQLATLAGTRIRIVHIHQKMQPAFHARGLNIYNNTDRLLRGPMEDYVADIACQVARTSSVAIAPMLMDESHVYAGLADLVASSDDIIVMATRGRSHISRILAGSGLDTILNSRQAPILHIRGNKGPVDFSARPSLRHALVPLDGTLESESILRPVADISKRIDGRQTFLRVMHSSERVFPLDGDLHNNVPRLKEDPINRLQVTAKIWKRELPRIQSEIAWSDYSPGKEILLQAEECKADFIAVATRDRNRMSRLLRPGVFDYLVRRSPIPVLVIKLP